MKVLQKLTISRYQGGCRYPVKDGDISGKVVKACRLRMNTVKENTCYGQGDKADLLRESLLLEISPVDVGKLVCY